jgi:ribosome-associated translation inhibitor RaiA
MMHPLQILFHNTQPIEDVETRIRQEMAELEKFYSQIVSCRVDVEVPEHRRHGSVSKIRVDLGVPGRSTMVKREAQHLQVKAQHKDLSMAVHSAFNVARRRLQDFAGRS